LSFIQRLRWWLRGRWRCVRWGRLWYGMNFGYGNFVGPCCYHGEQPLMWPRGVITGRLKASNVG